MSFWRTYYHLVWTTKYRAPIITAEFEDSMYAYMVSRADELEVVVYAVNGWYDHVHLLAAIPPKHAVSAVVKYLKGTSSHVLNHQFQLDQPFAWQRGYGVLTLGERQRPIAEAYIRNQKQHHQAQTTIGWLEYTTDMNEGPQPIQPKQNEQMIREVSAPYDGLGDLPW